MLKLTTDFALYSYVMALRYVPRNLNIPEDYWISTYANYAIPTNRQIIESTPEKPTGLTNVTWPARKVFGELIRLFNYAVDEPFIACAYHIEKALRGDCNLDVKLTGTNVPSPNEHSATYPILVTLSCDVKYAEQNVQSLNKHADEISQTQLVEPEPDSAEALLEMMELSLILILELQVEIKQLKEPIETLKQQVRNITQTKKYIDLLETGKKSEEKITTYVWTSEEKPLSFPFKWSSTQEVTNYIWTSKKTLSSHGITSVEETPLGPKLEIDKTLLSPDSKIIYDQKLNTVKTKLREAIKILTITQDEYDRTVEIFTHFMNKYEELGFEQTDQVRTLKKKAKFLFTNKKRAV